MTDNDSSQGIVDKAPTRLERARVADIRENETALRGVDRTNEEYIRLVQSVKKDGIIETITVRDCEDPVTKQHYYGLINGLQRFNAAKDAGYDEIDVKVITATDYEVLEKQIILNAQRVQTKPAEYSQQIKRMLTMNPALTLKELADRLSVSEQFLYERLSLLKLNNDIAKLVDDGKIGLTNAYALAKLPVDEQMAFKDRAITQTPQEFTPPVTKRLKELNEAKRKGQDAKPESFEATPRLRKLDEVKQEYLNPALGKVFVEKLKITDPIEAFAMGVKWALHMDPNSIAQAKAKDEARKKEQADAKARRDKEKEEREGKADLNKVLGVAPKVAAAVA